MHLIGTFSQSVLCRSLCISSTFRQCWRDTPHMTQSLLLSNEVICLRFLLAGLHTLSIHNNTGTITTQSSTCRTLRRSLVFERNQRTHNTQTWIQTSTLAIGIRTPTLTHTHTHTHARTHTHKRARAKQKNKLSYLPTHSQHTCIRAHTNTHTNISCTNRRMENIHTFKTMRVQRMQTCSHTNEQHTHKYVYKHVTTCATHATC